MESIIKKLGKTSITVEKDYHSSEKEYNKLTVVEEQGAFKTYLSRKPVPVGIELTNREYWIPFSGIKESLIIDYEKFKKEINNNINPIVIAYLVAHPELIVNVQNKSINIPKLAEDVVAWFNKLQTDIDTEADTARHNEQSITTELNNESNRAKSAESILNEYISTESDRAKEVELSIQKTLENISKTGEASAASNVTYIDNIEVGSTNLQDAIDKLGKKTLDGENKLFNLEENQGYLEYNDVPFKEKINVYQELKVFNKGTLKDIDSIEVELTKVNNLSVDVYVVVWKKTTNRYDEIDVGKVIGDKVYISDIDNTQHNIYIRVRAGNTTVGTVSFNVKINDAIRFKNIDATLDEHKNNLNQHNTLITTNSNKITSIENIINEEIISSALIKNQSTIFDVLLKAGYEYTFSCGNGTGQVEVKDDTTGTSIKITTLNPNKVFNFVPENDITKIITYCNGEGHVFTITNSSISNIGLSNKIKDVNDKISDEYQYEAKQDLVPGKFHILPTKVKGGTVYEISIESNISAISLASISNIYDESSTVEIINTKKINPNLYIAYPTKNAVGFKITSGDTFKGLKIKNPVNLFEIRKDLNNVEILSERLKKKIEITYLIDKLTIKEGKTNYSTSRPISLLKPGQTIKYKVECDNGIITGFGVGTDYGRYINGINEQINTLYTHVVPKNFFKSVITPDGIEHQQTLFRLTILSENVIGTGDIKFYLCYDSDETIERKLEVGNSVINIDEVNESKYVERYNALEAIKMTIPDYSINETKSIIRITNQSEFDNIKFSINNNINKGQKNILILLDCDKLYFSEKHFNFISSEYKNTSDVNITISATYKTKVYAGGNNYNIDNAIFLGSKVEFPYNNPFYYKNVYLCNDEEIMACNNIKYAESIVEPVTTHTSNDKVYVDIAKIKLQKEDYLSNPDNILITASFESYVCEVIKSDGVAKIEDGYLYFNAKPLKNWRHGMTEAHLNADYYFANVNPRYILFNTSDSPISIKNNKITFASNLSNVHECVAQTFIYVENCFNKIEICNINFIGNADLGVQNYNPETVGAALIQIDEFNGNSIYIHNNYFKYIRSEICSVAGDKQREADNLASNIKFSNNTAFHCYRGLISASQYSSNIYVIANKADDMGRAKYYEGTINVVGSDFLIANNEISNFEYSAFRSGIEYPRDGWAGSKGIVENNIFYWTPEYAAESWKHGHMDCGALYTYCRHTQLIIRNNLIYGYKAYKGSHGIFIDGYAENINVYSNMVIDCGDTYSIKMYKSNDKNMSTNNFIIYNIITSPYEFSAWDNSQKGINYCVIPIKSKYISNNINCEDIEDDYILENGETLFKAIRLPKIYNEIIDSVMLKEEIKKHIFFDKI